MTTEVEKSKRAEAKEKAGAAAQQTPLFYMAPMLGITDASFRTAFMSAYGGFDCAISPFIRTLQGQRFKKNGVADLQPQNNALLAVFPQILTNQIDDFIHLAEVLFDMGYAVINLNMGCPVHSASGKGCGAGLLPEVDHVDRLLDKVLSAIPNKLSIKTRIGFEAEDDLLKMASVLNRYPLQEVIIHPRTATQKYEGEVNHQAFAAVCEVLRHEIVYSGDIVNSANLQHLRQRYPQINKWMIGRGMLRDPWLMLKIRGQQLPAAATLKTFFRTLAELYLKRDLSPHIVNSRLKILLVYLGMGYEFSPTTIKALRKADSIGSLLAQIPRCEPTLC